MGTTPSTAPYFLNLIFDRLPENDFETFYGQIYQSPAVQANARPINANGILLFYSGQLIALHVPTIRYKLGKYLRFISIW